MHATDRIVLTHGVTVEIHQDPDPQSPADWDNLGEITYRKRSQYCLGTKGVEQEELDAITAGIKAGKLIGIPVYAFVHSGSSIKASDAGNPFNCPWDSGRSGWAYCTVEKAIAEFGKKRLTKRVHAEAVARLFAEVDSFDQYLRGDVYGFVVKVGGDVKDSCWGFYGYEHAKKEGEDAGKYEVQKQIKEAAERRACEERDIVTAP